MYSRTLANDDQARSFGVSGMLWHGVLVMYDRETDSLWTQLDGRAIDGDLAGERLEHVPSVFTTWSEWVAQHPDTQALDKPEDRREETASAYAEYLADPEDIFFEHLDEGLGAVRAKDVVFGVVADGVALAVTEALLEERSSVLVQVGSTSVLFLRDPLTGWVDAAQLAGDAHLLLPDTERGSERGRGTAHEPDGEDLPLRSLRVDRAFWYAWARSHPGSLILAGS